MELIIRNTTNQPIYDQIYAQIKAQIIAGKLAPGEALPSIRALAKDLRISVITTKRAYDELEADGFLYTCLLYTSTTTFCTSSGRAAVSSCSISVSLVRSAEGHPAHWPSSLTVSYTHLDVYKRQ